MNRKFVKIASVYRKIITHRNQDLLLDKYILSLICFVNMNSLTNLTSKVKPEYVYQEFGEIIVSQ